MRLSKLIAEKIYNNKAWLGCTTYFFAPGRGSVPSYSTALEIGKISNNSVYAVYISPFINLLIYSWQSIVF